MTEPHAPPPGPPADATDEDLVALARRDPRPPAAARSLYMRYEPVIRRFVSWFVRRGLLPASEAEDGRQEGALVLLQAVRRFDPGPPAVPFRALYRLSLAARLNNLRRAWARREGRLDRSAEAGAAADARAGPAEEAQLHEGLARLAEALARLGGPERRFWAGLAGGRTIRGMAEEAGVPYDAAKRFRRGLMAWLRRRAGGGVSTPPPTLPEAHAMSDSDPVGLHRRGVAAYDAGRAAEAVGWFGRAADAQPGEPLYHTCLGAALQAAGRPGEAEAAHRRALALRPGDGQALNNLGITLCALGRHAEAEAALRGALAAGAGDAAAWCNLGAALQAQARSAEAEAACREALRVMPGLAQAHTNLGNALEALGRFAEAEACHRRAAELRPHLPQAWRGLAALLLRRGRPAEAAGAFARIIKLAPSDAAARVGLAECLLALNRFGEAADYCSGALALDPGDADAHNGLGNALAALGQLAEAAAAYGEAGRLRPGWSVSVYNRGVALQGQGLLAEARAAFQEALRLNPADHVAHSTYVGSLLFDAGADAGRLLTEGRRWAEAHAPAPAAPPAHADAPDPSRRLRVGYVSPDFRSHAVAFFLEPVLAQHDPAAVELFCYADVAAPDETTARLRGLAHGWRVTSGLTDDEVGAMIRRDAIDVLVDLGGHLAGNRLRVFARRPAPVQVSWLGYPAGTGVPAIDFRLTDAVCDPPAEQGGEALLRLPGPFCCYGPPLHVPQRIDLPWGAAGGVVFGSLHKLEKLNDGVLDLWARLLLEVPNSRHLLCRNTLQGATADLWRGRLARRGLPPERVELRHVVPLGLQHLRVYDGIDVALDCFPWSGHTTACEALWMGVPVVTLRGRTCAGRMVASVLKAVGLDELVAETPDDYRRVAVELAGDRARRKRLRETLRQRMLRSPLCDKAAFTRGLEGAYRALWRDWCGERTVGASGSFHPSKEVAS